MSEELKRVEVLEMLVEIILMDDIDRIKRRLEDLERRLSRLEDLERRISRIEELLR